MSNQLTIFLLLMFSQALVPAAHAAPDAASCLTCHGAMQGSMEKEKGVIVNLNIDQDRFSKSVHSFLNCVECHMGFTSQPHQAPAARVDAAVQNLANALSAKSKIDAVAQAACAQVQCHGDVYKAYKASVHGQNVIVKKSSDGPVCTSCHGSPHYIQPRTGKDSRVNHFNVVETCGSCHEEKHLTEKYKFSPLVMERYKESFHGRKLKLGHSGAPACSDCHGAHDIRKAADPASPVSGANKLKTCGKCHPGATTKFVAAITHKPLHPVAHYAELGLIILTVGTFLFIIIHVLLDVYADIRDRLFRKGGNHE
ncbi:MAG: hypothetical protein AABZ10_11200 [Nitrospirota bacterium]